MAIEALSFQDRLVHDGLALLQTLIELGMATQAKQPDVVRQEGGVSRAVRVVAGLARAGSNRLVNGLRLRKAGGRRHLVAALAEGARLILQEPRAARRMRVVARGAGPLPHRPVHEGLREFRFLRFMAGETEIGTGSGRELWLIAAVGSVARDALARFGRSVHDLLRQPFLRLTVAGRAELGARDLQELLLRRGVRGMAGGAASVGGRLVRELARHLPADVLVAAEAQLFLDRGQQRLLVARVRSVAGRTVGRLEGLVDDRFLQVSLLVRVAIEAELRLSRRQLRLASRRRLLMAARAIRRGRMHDLAE